MSSDKYVKARGGLNNITIYYTEGNRLMIRSGGKWTWRNNNPGNMRAGAYSRNNGCIGYSGGYAVFPTLEQGEIALRDLLKMVIRTLAYNAQLVSLLQKQIKTILPNILNSFYQNLELKIQKL
jgi:hypothetical protein